MLLDSKKTIARMLMGLMLALLVCSLAPAQDVTSNSMPGVDFSKYHTYKWVTIEGATYPNQIVDAQIKQSIDSQLASKGLTKVDGDKADLYIGYQASIVARSSGMLTAWAAACVGAAAWPQLNSPPSALAP